MINPARLVIFVPLAGIPTEGHTAWNHFHEVMRPAARSGTAFTGWCSQQRGLEPLPRGGAASGKVWNCFQGAFPVVATVWNRFQGVFPAVTGLPGAMRSKRILIFKNSKSMATTAKQILSFALTQLTTGGSCDFHEKVNALIVKYTPAALHVEELSARYVEEQAQLASIVNRSTTYVSTRYLREDDKTRDGYISVINGVVRAQQYNPIEEKRKAAFLLLDRLAPYANISKHQYAKQTAEVNGMLKMLDEEELKEALKTLGLETEVTGLRTANEKFDASLAAKVAEATERQSQTTLKTTDVLNAVNATYQSIVQVVNAFAIAVPTEAVNGFIDELNGVVTVYAATINRRTSGGSAAAGDEPENPDDSGESGYL